MDITALIFDFDGTLLDTETPIYDEWGKEYRRHGQTLEESLWSHALGTHGVIDLAVHLAELLSDAKDPEDLRRDVRHRIRQRLLTQPLRPGVEAFLEDVSQAQLPAAIASSSSSGWVEEWLKHHSIRSNFEAVCCRDHVERVKPEPDLFLLAARKLDTEPGACLVIEDSPNGVRAARNAGMRCLAVPNDVTRRLEMPVTDLKVESFEGLSLAEIVNRL